MGEASEGTGSNGRGRGRGRGGGIAVLPEGMWEGLNPKAESKEVDTDKDEHLKQDNAFFREQEDDYNMPPLAFGGRRGGRGGRGGKGKGGGREGGKGYKQDAKGKDWECPSCSNVNWSWRESCNMCSTQRPKAVVATEEQRDGVGGGFNERQERMSTAALEVADDGFDDFGRRAKGHKTDRKAKEAAALARLQSSYGFLNAKDPSSFPVAPAEYLSSSQQPNVTAKDNNKEEDRTRSYEKEKDASSAESRSRHRDKGRSRSRERRHDRHRRRDGSRSRSRSRSRNRSQERNSDRRDRERDKHRSSRR